LSSEGRQREREERERESKSKENLRLLEETIYFFPYILIGT
jgi:hypothetical protein